MSTTKLPVELLKTTGAPDGTKFLRDDGQWTAAAGGGDMLAATYDPTGVNGAAVFPLTTQTLQNKTIDGSNNTLTVNIADLNTTGTASAATFLRGDGAWATPAGGGDVVKVGTPVNNEIGVWTGDGTIEGDTNLQWDGSALAVTGNITVTGNVDGRDLSVDGTKLDGISPGAEVNDANTVLSNAVTSFTKQQHFSEATLTDAVNISWNLDDAQVAKVTLTDNRTLDNPTNMQAGACYILRVIQDATGSRTLSFGSAYKWPGGTAPTLTTTANAVDVITFISDGTNMFGVFQGDFS